MSTVRYFNPTMRKRILAGRVPWWVEQHPRRSYIIAANLATPDWVNRDELTILHRAAKWRSEVTGVEHVLDHIIPLCHPMVCGLTVPWNLQIMTRAQNATKSNRWNIDQLELLECDLDFCSCSPRCSPWPRAQPNLSGDGLLTIPLFLRERQLPLRLPMTPRPHPFQRSPSNATVKTSSHSPSTMTPANPSQACLLTDTSK